VLRAKIDMASPNINLRDPVLYRIKRATHHNTGNAWCIYPMYTYAHPLEDALEQITHSICTLEFEDQRPFYDWVLERLVECGLLAQPLPRQYEFARLNLTYIVTSKRKLRQLVEEGIVDGWDDPRLPTLVGMRRRGYTPESLRLLAERSGVSKAGGWIDYSALDIALRDDLDAKAPRAMAVLDPLKLVLSNWDRVIGRGQTLPCSAPRFPGQAERGTREFTLGPEVWIEREDFMAEPPRGYHRLSPPRRDAAGKAVEGSVVRLKYGYVIRCTGFTAGADGQVSEVQAELIPDTRSGTPGADAVKTKGVLTWVAAHDALRAEVRLFDRLFTEAQPDAAGRDFKACLNPHSKQVVAAWLEPSLAAVNADERFQFERHGYFVADRKDHAAGAPVFNRITALKDSWAK
ncbi:MAG TPA: glutamate--tRNA ligase family protein, partial [Rubrivivax sp.]|nr:glutamate--tRNA ligase family protein [Rubrivivax sp.]